VWLKLAWTSLQHTLIPLTSAQMHFSNVCLWEIVQMKLQDVEKVAFGTEYTEFLRAELIAQLAS